MSHNIRPKSLIFKRSGRKRNRSGCIHPPRPIRPKISRILRLIG